MNILTNFWVQKRYQRTCDNDWMLFLWGFAALSMLHALEIASKKNPKLLTIIEESPKRWRAEDLDTGTKYVIEMRDDRPEFPDTPNISVRDQTLPVIPERKRMPIPGSMFSKQMDLF